MINAHTSNGSFRVEENGQFEGYADLFDQSDDLSDYVTKAGAFSESLKRHKENGTKPAVLGSDNNPIGILEDIQEDERGLYVKGKLVKGLTAYDSLISSANTITYCFLPVEAEFDSKSGKNILMNVDLKAFVIY